MDSNQKSQMQQAVNSISNTINKSNKSKFIHIIFSFAAVVIISVCAYLLGTKQNQHPVPTAVQVTPIPSPTPDLNAHWKDYQNEKYGFKLKLPPGYKLEGPHRNTSSDYFYIRQSNNVPDAYLTIYKIGFEVNQVRIYVSKKNILINMVPGTEYKYTYTEHFSKEEYPCSIYQLKANTYIYEFSGYEGCINIMPTALKIMNSFMIID